MKRKRKKNEKKEGGERRRKWFAEWFAFSFFSTK